MKPAAREWQVRHSVRAGNRQVWSRRPSGADGSGTSNSSPAPPAGTSSASVCAAFHRYEYPVHSPCCRTSKRVSIRLRAGLPAPSRRSRDSVCTRTEPLGSVQAPPALSWDFCTTRSSPGRAANRTIDAPSAHCGRDDLEGDRGRVRRVGGDRREQPRLAQPHGEWLFGPVGLGRRLEAIETTRGLVDDVQLAGVVGAEPGDVEGRVDQLAVPGGLLAVVPDPPDAPGGPIAVDVDPVQLGQPCAAVDPAAGERTGLAVGMVGRRQQDRVGAGLAACEEEVAPLEETPAVVATLLDQVDLLPGILPVVADPELARPSVVAQPPGITQAVGPDLRPCAGTIDERVVFGHAVIPAAARDDRRRSAARTLAGRRSAGRSAWGPSRSCRPPW